jgi:hypothetical protein
MIGRTVFVLMALGLLVSGLGTWGLPRSVSAQDPLPTPEGRLGGRMPLPTAEGQFGGPLPQDTPTPSAHPLVGAWLLAFAEAERAPAQVVFGDDGIVAFLDTGGNEGAGVWQPHGEQSGILAVVVPAGTATREPGQITMLQGTIDVASPGDTATLFYMVETVNGSPDAPERAGPFTAMGQRLNGEPRVPTPE